MNKRHEMFKSVFMKVMIYNPAKISALLALLLSSAMLLHAGPVYKSLDNKAKASATLAAKKAEMRMMTAMATSLYAEMDLQDSGLSRSAFQQPGSVIINLRNVVC